MKHQHAILAMIGCLVLLGLGQGCSSFDRQWKAAERSRAPSDSVAGRWEGQWLNHPQGTSGRLRCVIQPAGDGGEYRVYYEFERWRMFTQRSVATLSPQQTNDVYHFEATADLGGGLYYYRGQIVGSHFAADYRRDVQDYGRFEMTRLE
jgi:hypothetical protein